MPVPLGIAMFTTEIRGWRRWISIAVNAHSRQPPSSKARNAHYGILPVCYNFDGQKRKRGLSPPQTFQELKKHFLSHSPRKRSEAQRISAFNASE
jgi:hypothetical protein